MLIKKPSEVKPSEITDCGVYRARREFMRKASLSAVAGLLPAPLLMMPEAARAGARLAGTRSSRYSTGEKQTSYRET